MSGKAKTSNVSWPAYKSNKQVYGQTQSLNEMRYLAEKLNDQGYTLV